MFNHHTAQLWFDTRPILGSCEIILDLPGVCVPCGPRDRKIAIFAMAIRRWLRSWASSPRTKPKFFERISIIYNSNTRKFGSDSTAVGWFWARRHRRIRRWRRARNAATTIDFLNLTTLHYLVRIINAKPRSSGLDDLGLAPFDAIVAFRRSNAFAGIVRCLEVLVDPQTRICPESWHGPLLI